MHQLVVRPARRTTKSRDKSQVKRKERFLSSGLNGSFSGFPTLTTLIDRKQLCHYLATYDTQPTHHRERINAQAAPQVCVRRRDSSAPCVLCAPATAPVLRVQLPQLRHSERSRRKRAGATPFRRLRPRQPTRATARNRFRAEKPNHHRVQIRA